jgi:hypothetical protein
MVVNAVPVEAESSWSGMNAIDGVMLVLGDVLSAGDLRVS